MSDSTWESPAGFNSSFHCCHCCHHCRCDPQCCCCCCWVEKISGTDWGCAGCQGGAIWCHLTIWSIIWLLSGAVINHSHRAFCFYIPVGLCATSGPELEKKKPERSTISLSTQDGTGAYCISISSISSFWQIGKEVVLGIAGASLLWLEDATLVMGHLVILAPTVEIPAIRVWLICLSCDYKRRWLRLWSSLWQVQEAQWYLSWAWHRLVEDGEKGNELVNVKILVVIITSSLRPSY